MELLDRINRNPKEKAEALFNKGVDLAYEKKWEKAIRAYDRALKINPGHYLAWINKGYALAGRSNLGRIDEEIQAYDHALAIMNLPLIWYNKGVALLQTSRYEESIQAFDRALELCPEGSCPTESVFRTISLVFPHARSFYNKAFALSKLKKYQDAINACNKALSYNPDDNPYYAAAYHMMGTLLEAIEKHNEAEEYYKLAGEWNTGKWKVYGPNWAPLDFYHRY